MADTAQDNRELSTREAIALLLVACALMAGFFWVYVYHPIWLFWLFCLLVLIWIWNSPGWIFALLFGFWLGS